jgi:hypothetical protein
MIILVHTPVHASWLNQVEISFSIIQRKALTPNDFADLEVIRLRLALYEELSNQNPTPFQRQFDRAKRTVLLVKIEARQMALADTQFTSYQWNGLTHLRSASSDSTLNRCIHGHVYSGWVHSISL